MKRLIPTRPVVGLLDGSPVVAETLELLLREAGYRIVHLDELFIEKLSEQLADVQLLILVPTRNPARRKALLGTETIRQAMAKILVLELLIVTEEEDDEARSTTTNRLGRPIGWPCRIETLEREIEAALLAGP
jgi:hypothetical protein